MDILAAFSQLNLVQIFIIKIRPMARAIKFPGTIKVTIKAVKPPKIVPYILLVPVTKDSDMEDSIVIMAAILANNGLLSLNTSATISVKITAITVFTVRIPIFANFINIPLLILLFSIIFIG